MGSKINVNIVILSVKPCWRDKDNCIFPITLKLKMNILGDERMFIAGGKSLRCKIQTNRIC